MVVRHAHCLHLLQGQLRSVLGDRLTFNPAVLQSHGQDESYHHPVPPQVYWPAAEPAVLAAGRDSDSIDKWMQHLDGLAQRSLGAEGAEMKTHRGKSLWGKRAAIAGRAFRSIHRWGQRV